MSVRSRAKTEWSGVRGQGSGVNSPSSLTPDPSPLTPFVGPAGPPREPTQRILRNSTFNLTSQAVNAACHVVVVFVLARGLGKEVLGEFYTLYALITVVQLVLEAGLSTVLTRRIAQAPARWKETAAEATALFTLIALASVAVFVGLGGAWAWHQGASGHVLNFAIAGVTCAAVQIERFAAGVYRGFEVFGYENVARILQGLLFAGSVIAAVVLGRADLRGVLAMLAASHVVAVLFLLGPLQRDWRCLGWRLSRPVVKSWLAEGGPLGVGDVVRGLTWQLDTVLLGLLQPPAVVGIYSLAYRPLGPLNWVPRAVLAASFPSFAHMATHDRETLGRAFADSIRLLWVLSLPLAVAVFVCAGPIISLLAGPEFLEAELPLRILIWIAALSFVSIQYRFLFAAVGQLRSYARLVVAVFVVEAVIELALIPRWGYFGACTGSMVGELMFTAAGLAMCRRLGIRQIDGKALAGAAAAAAAMAALLWFSRGAALPILALAVVLSAGLYLALCVVFGAVRPGEVRHFARAVAGCVMPSRGPVRFTDGAPHGPVS